MASKRRVEEPKKLGKSAISEARAALNRDGGRCTPISLLFVADRLLDQDGDEEELGKEIRTEVAKKALRPSRIDHMLFTLSGNASPKALAEDFKTLGKSRRHVVVNLHIDDHQEFIRVIYEEAGKLGDD